MKITAVFKKYRSIITIILAVSGIGIMMYYDYCDTACSYLKGDIWGIDLKWIGIAYMLAVIVFAVLRQTSFVRALLAGGLGVEVYLYAFQIQNDIYCPFCLAFSVMVIAAFAVNYEIPSMWLETRRRRWLYFLGEVDFPMFRIKKMPLVLVSILGYLIIMLTFSGSVTPAYGQEKTGGIPALGKGPYEITVFADYFCPPCRMIDAKAEPLFKELLATGLVKITFVDVPFASATPLYARYYLYAVNAGADVPDILHIRRILFDAAQIKSIKKEEELIAYLKEQNLPWKKMNEKPVLSLLNSIIKENKIDQTPVCIVKYYADGTKKYVGTDEIWDGLTKLQAHLAAKNKNGLEPTGGK